MANFAQRTNGKWQAKIRRTGWPVQSKTFDTKADAQRWARATEREMDVGAFIARDDAEKTTFTQAAERYADEIVPRLRGQQQALSLLKKLDEHFGRYSLASINAALIAAYRDQRMKAVSAQTVKHELGMLSRVFKACSLDWGIALPQGLPTALVRKPTVSNSRERRLEIGEWEALSAALSTCSTPYPLAAVELAIETGARQSELCSLTWEHIDLPRKVARLRGVDGNVTKNGDPHREIPLSSRATSVLTALPRSIKGKVLPLSQNALQIAWERALQRARRHHVHHELAEQLNRDGLSESDIQREIRALVYKKRAPLATTIRRLETIEQEDQFLLNLRFHDLRHEATSRLAEKFQLHELMKITGHKSSTMLTRYYHPRAEDLAKKMG